MRPLFAVAALIVPIVLACGGGAPRLTSPSSFSDRGVAFSYPSNWTIEAEDDVIDGAQMQTITVSTANDGQLTVISYDQQMDLTAESFADGIMLELPSVMKEMLGNSITFEIGATGTTSREIAGQPTTGQTRAFELILLGVHVPHTVEVYSITTEQHHVMLFRQVSDEELVGDAAGFDLIYSSLVIE